MKKREKIMNWILNNKNQSKFNNKLSNKNNRQNNTFNRLKLKNLRKQKMI